MANEVAIVRSDAYASQPMVSTTRNSTRSALPRYRSSIMASSRRNLSPIGVPVGQTGDTRLVPGPRNHLDLDARLPVIRAELLSVGSGSKRRVHICAKSPPDPAQALQRSRGPRLPRPP